MASVEQKVERVLEALATADDYYQLRELSAEARRLRWGLLSRAHKLEKLAKNCGKYSYTFNEVARELSLLATALEEAVEEAWERFRGESL